MGLQSRAAVSQFSLSLIQEEGITPEKGGGLVCGFFFGSYFGLLTAWKIQLVALCRWKI